MTDPRDDLTRTVGSDQPPPAAGPPGGNDLLTQGALGVGATLVLTALAAWIKRAFSSERVASAADAAQIGMLDRYRAEVDRALQLAETYRVLADEANRKLADAQVMIARLEGRIDALSEQIREAEGVIAAHIEAASEWKRRYESMREECQTCPLKRGQP